LSLGRRPFRSSPRCGDDRILYIFEGATEIQAQIIARGLVAGRD
jgi:alkylation response protein AidB-like acyl-CoA dehydrogenase